MSVINLSVLNRKCMKKGQKTHNLGANMVWNAIIDRVFPSLIYLSDELGSEKLETLGNPFSSRNPFNDIKRQYNRTKKTYPSFDTNNNRIVHCDSEIFTNPRKTVAVRYNIYNANESNDTFRIIFQKQRIPVIFALKTKKKY